MKTYINGREIEVEDFREIPGVKLIDLQTNQVFKNVASKISGVAGATVTAKGTIVQMQCMNLGYLNALACGSDKMRKVVTRAGQTIGKTTGQTAIGFLTRKEMTEIYVDAGVVPSTDSIILNSTKTTWVYDSEINILAGNQASGAGFPISNGSKGQAVSTLQNYLKNCGFSLGVWGADGDWGAATDQAVSLFNQKNPNNVIPRTIESQGQLNTIISRPCSSNQVPTNTGNTNTGTTGNTGNANNIPVIPITPDPTKTDVVAPAQDNTLLYVGGTALLLMMINKKKGKRKR